MASSAAAISETLLKQTPKKFFGGHTDVTKIWNFLESHERLLCVSDGIVHKRDKPCKKCGNTEDGARRSIGPFINIPDMQPVSSAASTDPSSLENTQEGNGQAEEVPPPVFESDQIIDHYMLAIRRSQVSTMPVIPRQVRREVATEYKAVIQEVIRNHRSKLAWLFFFSFPKCILRLHASQGETPKIRTSQDRYKLSASHIRRNLALWKENEMGKRILL